MRHVLSRSHLAVLMAKFGVLGPMQIVRTGLAIRKVERLVSQFVAGRTWAHLLALEGRHGARRLVEVISVALRWR